MFVVTHQPPADSPEDGVYTFVTDGIEDEAIEADRVAADVILTPAATHLRYRVNR